MRAASWDADAEIGGEWTTVAQRIAVTPAGKVALPLAEPCTLDLWPQGVDSAAAAPVLSVPGVLAGSGQWARFTISAAQLGQLGVGTFEQRLVLGDPADGPIVMARGWFTVRGRATDL